MFDSDIGIANFEKLPLHLYILLHLKRAGVDYSKMISKITGIDVEIINSCIDDLIKAGYVERDSGTAIKRSRARFKKAFEVRKHHKYYKLTKKGEQFIRKIDEEWLKNYLDSIVDGLYDMLKTLYKERTLKVKDSKNSKLFEEMRLYRFITENGKSTKFFRAFSEFTFKEFDL